MKASNNIESFFASQSPSFLMEGFLFCCFGMVLIFPNVIFSGDYWYQTLHLMKWFFAFVPIAMMVMVLWIYSFRSHISFTIDFFSILWFIFLLYMAMQPVFIEISSIPSFIRGYVFFASLFALYCLTLNFFKETMLSFILWGSSIAGVLSVFFAELQLLGINGVFPFILNTPGHYIANTGQQNMFGIWLALCALNTMFLYIKKKSFNSGIIALFLLAIIEWGLWNTTSRSAIFGMAAGIFFMLIMALRTQTKETLKRTFAVVFIFLLVMAGIVEINKGRIGTLKDKFKDILDHPTSVAKRDSIWLTSWTMFRSTPVSGVGLGQYKWHYLEAQREMRHLRPEKTWQFTYWAHNEYLQWICETGVIGGGWLLLLASWWLWNFTRLLLRKRSLSYEAFWGISILALILGTALWTRPFHRIEDAVWISVAFGVANREIFLFQPLLSFSEKGQKILFTFAGMCVLSALLFFGHGLYGDRLVSLSLDSESAENKKNYLEKAATSLMVQDIAEKKLAYYYLNLGENHENPELVAIGLNRLYNVFKQQPHSRELSVLLDWGKKLENKTLIQEMSSFIQ